MNVLYTDIKYNYTNYKNRPSRLTSPKPQLEGRRLLLSNKGFGFVRRPIYYVRLGIPKRNMGEEDIQSGLIRVSRQRVEPGGGLRGLLWGPDAAAEGEMGGGGGPQQLSCPEPPQLIAPRQPLNAIAQPFPASPGTQVLREK